ncbi:phosphopantetheine-binding protein [Micromonospora echinofusca]|uniref:Acyl carrier protein n=1 Tax=Micromonospora echinofusca TaxID=47858 RepID=A0ABS3VUD2_MICEH|nr:phosphopantetheine-binding protein [Micromonospora echinofusca]MBO4208048.1 acyl carrier protein [Micromonospora echinofusca]
MTDPQFEEILRGHLPFLPADEPLTPDTNLTDHGLDSLGIVDLLTALEGQYGVAFVDDALTRETFETVGSLWSVLDGLRPAAV